MSKYIFYCLEAVAVMLLPFLVLKTVVYVRDIARLMR